MVENIQGRLMQHVQEVLRIKDERDVHRVKQIDYFSKFKVHLGKQQELTRQLNEKVDEFEEYRIGSVNSRLLDLDEKAKKTKGSTKKSKK
ncbi:hypothetical protein LCGC14_3080940 [marine sediment metagenome]|uniref:Uncharacterized protein n=1 Tax=marine sediment metagenome TaxID=412755 RepID=A0A0F8Z408_9ZZZZ